jgi:hypothetical protein
MRTFFLCLLLLVLYSCKKTSNFISVPFTPASGDTTGFVKYTIPAGAHFAMLNKYTPVETAELKFAVRFDSSAIYQTRIAQNQYDINKLYGFSDNGSDHHQFSARFGWRWSDGALRLFAYVYNGGKVASEELGVVRIGAEIQCRIKVTPDRYLFYCNEQMAALPRKSATAAGKGYRLYPYFGGDETAPHQIAIWIRPL